MKKIMLGIFGLIIILSTFMSCTQQERAKSWGGTTTLKLPENCIFINATWKNADLWLVLKDTTTNQYLLKESSSWGLLEGAVYITN
jgi:hypothetical protein